MRMILGVLAALAVLLTTVTAASGQSTSTTVKADGTVSAATATTAETLPDCWDTDTDGVSIAEVTRHTPGFADWEHRGYAAETATGSGGFTIVVVRAWSAGCDIRNVVVSARSLGSKHEVAVTNRLAPDRTERGGEPGDRTASVFGDEEGPAQVRGWNTATLLRMRAGQAYAVEATLHMR